MRDGITVGDSAVVKYTVRSYRRAANHLAFSSGSYARGMPNNSKMGGRFPTGACCRTRDEQSEGTLE